MALDFDALGREIPDPTRIPPPRGYDAEAARYTQIKDFIRVQLSKMAADQESESFEEADDFDIDEDPDPLSLYDLPEARVEWPGGVKDEDGDPPTDPSTKTAPEPDKGPLRASSDGEEVQGEAKSSPVDRPGRGSASSVARPSR